ncbi:MAG: 50S ribosomal protein L11 [Candidatus Diapherotrites archaeon ADurb.Bin253]|jgi:large subunit ribosomal protein L11|nr:50S ribosomal protein L11 [Candidatus Pacearchaeota archaeon]OQA67314.1 MAG: 50S ribosomal protein L11 [Candidatus Diapherotrites archaeon ADurb.Bin253]HNZ51811.1 50S ribosomal protein L11 [Candidatus Pacearchaeota archaeon]HOC97144.1 50S ribosomal protein L11 [Candidatus Pacearchaeota archaeon]HOF44403.1 50S ribosomal protein L11 [Candidatus Pacearchaeota archaeon]
MIIKILADGGAMKPGPALSQKLGPAGIPINQVIQKINEATSDFQGLKVPVELDVNVKTKTFDVKVFSPPVSGLLKKELGIAKGSGTQLKNIVGNASIEQIISIAKTKMQNLLCKDLKSAVKVVAGTCVSLGILIENKPAKEIEKDIEAGKYDKEISQVKTETSPEKKKMLNDYLKEVQKKQDLMLKQEQAAKEAAEQAAPAATATPAATASSSKAAPATKAKEPAKKK